MRHQLARHRRLPQPGSHAATASVLPRSSANETRRAPHRARGEHAALALAVTREPIGDQHRITRKVRPASRLEYYVRRASPWV